MSKADHLTTYAEGWAAGDIDRLLSSMADSFVLDDPNHGSVTKADMAEYITGFKATVDELRGGKEEALLLELSEVLTDEQGGELTASCWWKVPGTEIEGAGLIKVSERGVLSERLTYYTKLPG